MHNLDIGGTDFRVLATNVLRNANGLRFQARGGSMAPFIRNGDILLIQPVNKVRRGDVILCHLGNGRVLAHRVVKVIRDCGQAALLIQGDALQYPDGVISLKSVLGRVAAVERGGRRIVLDAGSWRLAGLLWVILSPFSRRMYRAAATLKHRVCS